MTKSKEIGNILTANEFKVLQKHINCKEEDHIKSIETELNIKIKQLENTINFLLQTKEVIIDYNKNH